MALGVRLLYPVDVGSYDASAQFVDHDAKYIVTTADRAKVTLRFRARSYDNFGEETETPSVLYPIQQVEISNTPDFSSGRTLLLPYAELDSYDVDTDVHSDITAVDDDFSTDCQRITNWSLDAGEGEKTVYIRFICSGGYTFPDPDGTYKGFQDPVVVSRTEPSMPKTLRVDNATDDNWVARDTLFSWQESQDNISGLRGYSFDLIVEGGDSIVENCDDLSDFDILDRYASDARLASELAVMRTRRTAALLPSDLTWEALPGESKVEASFANTGATARGHEVQWENRIVDADEGDRNNFEIKMKVRPTFPDAVGSSSSVYAAIQTFQGLYDGAHSLDMIPATATVALVPWNRKSNIDASISVEMYTDQHLLAPLTAAVKVLWNRNTRTGSFSLIDGIAYVEGLKRSLAEEFESIADRADDKDYCTYSLNLSDVEVLRGGVQKAFHSHLDIIPIVYNWGYNAIILGNFAEGSGAFGPSNNTVQIAALYSPMFGSLSGAEAAACHIRASIWFYCMTPIALPGGGFGWTLRTWLQRLDDAPAGWTWTGTYEGLSMASTDPVGYRAQTGGDGDVPYTHLESSPWGVDGDGTWTPTDPSWITMTFDIQPDTWPTAGTFGVMGIFPALVFEIWSDPSFGPDPPRLRLANAVEWRTANTPYTANRVAYASEYWSRQPIYNPDGSIAGYSEDILEGGLLVGTAYSISSDGGDYYVTPMVRIRNNVSVATSVNQIEASVQVVGLRTSSIDTIPATVTVLQSVTSSTTESIEATATVYQSGAGSGRSILPASVVVSRDVTRSSFRFIEGTVTVEHAGATGTSVSSIPAVIEVARYYRNLSTIEATVTVTGGTRAFSFIPASVFVSADWNQDPIYVDLSSVHTTINGFAPAWSDFILVDFDKDGVFTLYRPTWDVNGAMTGISAVTEIGVTDPGIDGLGDDDVEIEVAYRENRHDVEEVSLSSFGTETPIALSDTSEVWGDPLTILWQPFMPTQEAHNFSKLKVRVENQEPGGDWFHVQAVIVRATDSGLPDISDWSSSSDQRTDAFGLPSGEVVKSLRSCVWPEGGSSPTVQSGRHRLWSEMVWIPAGTSDVTLAAAGFSGSPSSFEMDPGTSCLIGVVFFRVDGSLGPDPALTFTSPGVDANFVYSPFRPLMRWKVLNVPLASELRERLVSGRALSGTEGINEYGATEQPTNPAIFSMEHYSGEPRFSTIPEHLSDTAELVVSYSRIGGDTTDRAAHRRAVTPLTSSPYRGAIVGMRAASMDPGEWASITYDYLRFSDTSIIPDIDLSGFVGYTVESQQQFEEEVHLVTTQEEWTDADWGVTWAKRMGANAGVDITNPSGDLVFGSVPGDPDDMLRSGEAQFLTPTQGDSFSVSVAVTMIAERLDAEFYVYILPAMYSANVSDIEQVSDQTPQDFMIVGFRYNGDIYLYRPDPNTGLVSSEMIHTLGSLTTYDWGSGDVRIRLTNATAGVTALSIWHDLSLLYTSQVHREFRPESDRGFWVGMGLRTKRDTTGALRLDVGNIKIQSVSRANPDIVNSVLFTESFSPVPIRWFTLPGVEEVYPSGSSVIHGIVRENTAEEYAAAHRIIAPSNVYSQPLYTIAVPPEDTLDVDGVADFYRMRLGVSIDDVTGIPQLTNVVRWIGPSLISPYGIYGMTTSDAIRIDLNYELSYPDYEGKSQVMFGIANWLPTNRAASRTNVITDEEYACFSFTETDDNVWPVRYNTRAQVNALLTGGSTGRIGYEDEQYLTSKRPSFALIAFGSDLKAYSIYGEHTSGDSESVRPTTSTLGQSFLPQRGVLSLIIKPVTQGGGGGGDDESVSISISATPSRITQGSSCVLAWTSQNATNVVSSNFGATAVTGQKTVTPTSSQTYTITVEGADGSRASASVYVTVDPPGTGPSVDLSANPTTINAGSSSILSWSSQNATEVVLSKTNIPGITQYQTSGSATVSPTTTTTYTITVKNAAGIESADSVTVTVGTVSNVTVNLIANPTTVASGGAVTLTWTSQNATQVIDTNFGATTVSGTKVVNPTANTTYYIRVANADRSGTAYDDASVTIQNSLTGTASVTPTSGNVGTVVTYSYNVPHASVGQVIISGPGMADQHIDMTLPSGSGTFTLAQPGTYSFYFGANTYEAGYNPSWWSKTVQVTCGNYPSGSHVPPTHVYQYSYDTEMGLDGAATGGLSPQRPNIYFTSTPPWYQPYSWAINETDPSTGGGQIGGYPIQSYVWHGASGDPPILVDGQYLTFGFGYIGEWAPEWSTATTTVVSPYGPQFGYTTYTFHYVKSWTQIQNTAYTKEVAVGPPVWLPPVNSNITGFQLVLTSTKSQVAKTGERVEGWKSSVGTTLPSGSGGTGYLTDGYHHLWWARCSEPISGLPDVAWDSTTYIAPPYGQWVTVKTNYASGEAITFDIKNAGIQWVNNGAASYGVRIGLYFDGYMKSPWPVENTEDVTLWIEPNHPALPDPSDHWVWMLNNRINIEFAGATHVTPQWRPYYVISYTTVGGLSVTARVPVGDVNEVPEHSESDLPPSEYLVSAQSVGVVRAMSEDPIYADIEVRVNNVDYVAARGVPFGFNSVDGMRLVCASRRKTPGGSFDVSATVGKFSMSYINIRALPSDEDAETLAMWIKTSGNVSSNTLIYGRNVDAWQEEDDSASPFQIVVGSGAVEAVIAQRFTAGVPVLRAASVRTNSTSTGTLRAYLCAVDDDGEPVVTPGVDGHVAPSDDDILATAFGRCGPGTTETFFIFNQPPTLVVGSRYAILFDYAETLHGSAELGTLPTNSAMRWTDSGWEDTGVVLAFRTFGDLYVNRENQHHGRRLSGRVAATSNAGMPESGQHLPLVVDEHTLGMWRMDEGSWSGTPDEVIDSSGHERHGTAFNGADTTTSGYVDRAGEFARASSHYVRLAETHDIVPDYAGDQTYELWFKPDSTMTSIQHQILVGLYWEWVPLDYHYGGIRYDSTNKKIYVSYEISSSTSSDDNVIEDEWNHVAWQWDSEAKVFTTYLNGKLQPSLTKSYTSARKAFPDVGSAVDYMYVGVYGHAHSMYYGGLVDEVRISDCVRYSNDFEIHAQIWQTKLVSDYTLPVTIVRADLLGPYAVGSTTAPPTIQVGPTVVIHDSNEGFIVELKIGAQDTLAIGSGVQDFRVIYETDFGEMHATDYKTWVDADVDGYVTFELYYSGMFLDTRLFYVEVRDRVGNVSRSQDLLVDFIYSYYQDTEAPYLVRVRIEGDAFIEPDPNEAIATKKTDVNVSLNVQDETTGPKDFRINRNFAETSTGALQYDDYRPYLFQFDEHLTGADGVYALGVQARDYADNATQPAFEHIERVAFDGRATVREMATAVASYSGALYVGTTRRTARTNVGCTNASVIGYEAYTVYEPWIGAARQTFTSNETIVVRVDGGVVTNYTVDYDNDWIVFDDPLGPEYSVQMDIVEEVAVLYRYANTRKRAVKVFDSEGERAISALRSYQGMLYVGTASGRIYGYNGIRTSLSLYRTTDALGNAVPVSCMAVGQFESDDELGYDDFLYVGTYTSPHVFRYGGNPANAELGWVRLSTLSTAMSSDTSVYAIAMYEDTLWVATGPYGRVRGYTRTLDEDGDVVEATRVSQLYADEFTADPSFRMDVLCLEPWDGRIYAGVDHASSVFVYELVRQRQPSDSEWLAKFEFNYDFEDSPLPWEFYNEGSVDHRNSDRISFSQVRDDVTGDLTDWYMTIDGRAGEFCCWIDRSQTTGSLWNGVSNATGWTMDVDLRLQDWGDDPTVCYQGISAYDGTYMLELRVYKDKVSIISGETVTEEAISFDVTQWHTYRLAVVGDAVSLYVDGDRMPIIREDAALTFETTGRAVMFGKVEGASGACNAQWRRLYHYLSGALSPEEIVERDWTRAQVIPFGNEVRYLVGTSSYLVVGVQPRTPAELTTYDDPTTLVPRTYRRQSGMENIWQLDARYESDVASLLAATLHDGHVWSTAEVSTDLLTNTQVDLPEFISQDPADPMLDDGNVYERRLTQSYDTIIKDTRGPEAAIVINEDTTAGAVQVFAMETYAGSGQHTAGFIATYSPLGVEVGSANQVIDGVADTYVSIGTSEVRYVAHDFGGDASTTLDITEIKWGCRSTVRKTYEVQYLDPTTGNWTMVASMISDRYGDAEFYRVVFSPALKANAIRIYYTGDRSTAANDVELTLSAADDGVGTAGYKVSRYQDMRDATSWTAMSDGTIRLSWELTQDAETWSTTYSAAMPFTAGIVFGATMVLAAADGYLHVSSDGTTFVQSAFQASDRINCFAEYRDALYMGTDDGKLYSSENAVDWTLIESDVQDRITALASFNDVLYIGTGDSGYLMTYDGETLTALKKFASAKVTALFAEGSGTGSKLHVGLSPTGQIYVYDGSSFTQSIDLPVNRVTGISPYRDVPYATCDKGRVYKYTTVGTTNQRAWTMLTDTARRRISGSVEHGAIGPTITGVSSEGVGSLASGTYRYRITYVDYAGVESVGGESYEFDNLSNVGRLRIDWQTIENARGYKVYRSPDPNQGEGSERLLDIDELTDTYFYDDGTETVLDGGTGQNSEGEDIVLDDVAPPTTSSVTMWFVGDSTYAYTWDNAGLVQVPLPATVQGGNGVLSFRSQVYVFGQERAYTDAELASVEDGTSEPVIAGKVTKWIGIGTGAGDRVVYAKFVDGIDNETSLLSDTIFYDTLLQYRIVEVDPNGTIVLEYESQSDPQQKLYSPHKMLEQVGTYESQPFYAANLSRWDVVELLAQLPYDTAVRLYVRTAETRTACLAADWVGPFTLENETPDLYYQPYESYEYGAYGYHYVDRSYYYYGSGILTTQTADISSLEGQWLQFRLELVTERKDQGPTVFYVVVRYKSTNAAMFYTTVFDLDEIANRERPQAGGIEARRGIITWNGHIPDGGDVRFGISTAEPETGDWSAYQEVTPNTTFEIDDPGNVKVAIMLISTDTDVAIVDEWAMMLDTGDRDVRINLET